MTQKEVDKILSKVAKENGVSLNTVKKEIIIALEEAQKNPDPLVQACWASIPKKGRTITIEEFLDYACNHVKSYPF